MMQHSSSSPSASNRNCLAAQLLACTVCRFIPNVLLMGGGVDSLGFYYDFHLEQPLTESMLEWIEVQLRTLIKEERPLRFISMMRENAQSLFEHHRQPFLGYFAASKELNILDLMQLDECFTLCPSLPLASTSDAGHVKLLDTTMCRQWVGEEEITVVRIRGVSQETFKDLKVFLKSYDVLLKKKDHRKLGPLLHLFSFSEQARPFGITWHPKGVQLRGLLQDWLNRQMPWVQHQISTPPFVKEKALAFDPSRLASSLVFENENFQLTPFPLLQHIDFLKSGALRQYDLPWRVTELVTVYQAVPDFSRWGLFNHGSYTADWTTIGCTEGQVLPELISSLQFIEQIIRIFGFEARWVLIASQQKSLKAQREKEAAQWLKKAAQSSALFYPFLLPVQESEKEREGPRLELRISDVIGREWPAASLSVVIQSENWNSNADSSSREQPMVVLTRQIWGSIDRMIALMIEKYEGILPLWLAPEQIRVLAIGGGNHSYAKEICQLLQSKGLRVSLDRRETKLSERVCEAEKEKVPYLILAGDQERLKGKIKVRSTEKTGDNQFVDIETFLDKLQHECLSPRPVLIGESE